jgi:hypothetical protein
MSPNSAGWLLAGLAGLAVAAGPVGWGVLPARLEARLARQGSSPQTPAQPLPPPASQFRGGVDLVESVSFVINTANIGAGRFVLRVVRPDQDAPDDLAPGAVPFEVVAR